MSSEKSRQLATTRLATAIRRRDEARRELARRTAAFAARGARFALLLEAVAAGRHELAAGDEGRVRNRQVEDDSMAKQGNA